MRLLFIPTIILFISSCKPLTEQEKVHRTISGDWLIAYPDHQLKNARQREIYGEIQDSVVSLTGLKLVRFSENGIFRQMDSLETEGRWTVSPDKVVYIEKGGKGFDNYSARFMGFEKGMLKLTETIHAKGDNINLVWHLKKVSGSSSSLFETKNNAWRKKPAKTESAKEIKTRLADMLNYYSDYYSLVTKEASYFIPTRIILPLKFYQHAMGMKSFDEKSFFASLFFNKQQAEQAYDYLSDTIIKLEDNFPSAENYVEEYALFMEKMAEEIVKE